MPIIKSAKKRMIQSEARRKRNVARKAAIKTVVKKVKDAVAQKDFSKAQELLREAEAQIARAAGKRVLHKNTASRKISRLASSISQAMGPVRSTLTPEAA